MRNLRNQDSADSMDPAQFAKILGGERDMMFSLVFGLYVCVCGCAGLHTHCGGVPVCGNFEFVLEKEKASDEL